MKKFSRCLILLALPLIISGCSKNKKDDPVDEEPLIYLLRGDHYAVRLSDSFVSNTGNDLTVPAEHNGLPVTEIDNYGFKGYYCPTLTLPETITKIGKNAFEGTAIKSLTLPSAVRTIEKCAFYNSDIEKVTINEGVKEIKESTFNSCGLLSEVSLPSTLEVIGEEAFSGCYSLNSLSIPNNIIDIGDKAFANTNISYYEYENGMYLGNSENPTLVFMAVASEFTGDPTISNTCRVIGPHALKLNTHNIVLPESVVSVCYRAFEDTHSYTFDLSHVTHIGMQAFWNSWVESVTFSNELKYLPTTCFYGCRYLTSAPLPESLEEIGYGAFYNAGIVNITLPSHLKVIGDCAFIGCKNLGNIAFPDTLEYLGDKAFYLCEKAHFTTYLPDGLKYLGYEAFYKTDYITYVYNYDNGRYISSKSNHFFTFFEVKDKTATSIELHEDTKLIAGEAFAQSKLTSLTLPDGVMNIGRYAFAECTDLEEVSISDTVTSISDAAFYHCTALKSITLPDSVAAVGDELFIGCSALQSATLSKNLKVISSGMFQECISLAQIDIPLSVIEIEDEAFYNCKKLTTINYAGTKEQMMGIILGEQWNCYAGTLTIHCSDGDVEVKDTDPYKV